MLGLRIATALVLAPLVIAAVFFLPLHWFALFFWALAALGCYEWAGLLQLQTWWQRMLYVAVFGVIAALLFDQTQWHGPMLLFISAVWLLAFVGVVVFPAGEALYRQKVLMALLGWLMVMGAWLALIFVRQQPQGAWWLLWAFVLVWAADIGAYFAGRAFGDRKLAPAVSPGKTWAGAIGGFGTASVLSLLGLYWLGVQSWLWLVIVTILIIASIMGDLFESVLKRATGVKDSGNLLPGHGGVLDRIDALLTVLPWFSVALMLAPR